MLKVILDKQNKDMVIIATGDIVEITSDTIVLINRLYHRIYETDKIRGDYFRRSIVKTVTNGTAFKEVSEE